MAKNALLALMMIAMSATLLVFAPASYAAKKAALAEKASLTGGSRKSNIKTASLTPGKIPSVKTNLMVLGDSLGNGVWTGLYQAFRKDKNIKIMRKSKSSTGFVRLDYYDWNANLTQILRKTKIDIAVVMIGANDRQTISTKAGRFRPGSKRWREIYASRVDNFTRQLKDHGARVYWVGLPITRRKKFSRHMQLLNNIFAERARVNNITFVDIWKDFTTANGRYSANGKDIKGRVRKLRANDGVHFTRRGYRKLAFATERFIRADFNRDVVATTVVKLDNKQKIPAQMKKNAIGKPPVVAQVPKPVISKPERKMQVAALMPELDMMPPAGSDDLAPDFRPVPGKITRLVQPKLAALPVVPDFIPEPRFVSVSSKPEKMKSLQLALNALARQRVPEVENAPQQVQKTKIVALVWPKFQPDAEYLAKNLRKTEKNDLGRVIRQALDNEFQDILSIVQPDKAVVVSAGTIIAPTEEVQLSKLIVLPVRQQMRETATLSLSSDLLLQPEPTKRAPSVVGIVRPVSVESGMPDGKVEYDSETIYQKDAFTGTVTPISVASVSGVDFKTITDGKGNFASIAYRTLLRGDALSPKSGRGDDFSWPRD